MKIDSLFDILNIEMLNSGEEKKSRQKIIRRLVVTA